LMGRLKRRPRREEKTGTPVARHGWPPVEMRNRWEFFTSALRVILGSYFVLLLPEAMAGFLMMGYGALGAIALLRVRRKGLGRAIGWATRLADIALISTVAYAGAPSSLAGYLLPIVTGAVALGPEAGLELAGLAALAHVAAVGKISTKILLGSLLLCLSGGVALFFVMRDFRSEWMRRVRMEAKLGVLDVEEALKATRDIEKLFDLILSAALMRTGAEGAALFLLDEEGSELFVREAMGFDHLEEGTRIPIDGGILSKALTTGRPQLVADLEQESPIEWDLVRMRSALLVPLEVRRRITGLIGVFSSKSGAFGGEDAEVMRRLAEEASAALESAQLLARLREEARTDPLTRLYNRRYFERRLRQELKRAARHHYLVSLAMFDIDGFKRVNDEFGHLVGDRVLRAIGQILKRGSRESDVPARFGGEEFAVILPHTSKQGALKYAERIRKTISSRRVKANSTTVSVTVSGGVATFPLDASSPEELIASADFALYEAKMAGRNCVRAAPEREE